MSADNRMSQLAAPPLFVVGAARSGTTWVTDIFAAHPQVAAVLESWLFTTEDGLGALFRPAHRYGSDPRGLGRLMPHTQTVSLVRQTAESILSAAIQPEHRFLVEKSPSHLFVMPLIAEIFPDARFVHVIRDGRDVAVSVEAAVKSWMPRWANSFGASVAATASAWRDAILTAQRHGQAMNGRYLEIRYEAIKQDPFAGYRQLFDFAAIPYDDDLLQHVFNRTDFAKNYRGNERGFRRAGRVGDWQQMMTRRQRQEFDHAAGDVLVALGYAADRQWWRGQGWWRR